MLSAALIPLKNDIFKILTSDDCKKAFEQAILTTFPADSMNDSNTKKVAENFGKAAAAYMGALAGPLADAIDKYVKEIGIMIAIKPTVTSPMGPCSGVISPTDVTIL